MIKASSSFLPDNVKAYLRRACVFCAGFALAALSLVLAGAFATYSPADPSFNTAADGGAAVSNAAGVCGAYVSDLLHQYFGWAGILFPAALFAWSVIIMRGLWTKRQWWRVAAFVPAVASACLFLTALTISFSSVFPAEAGGVLAMGIYIPVAQALTFERFFVNPQIVAVPLFFVLTIAGAALTFGIPFEYIGRAAKAVWSAVKSLCARLRLRKKAANVQDDSPADDEPPQSVMPVQEEMFAPEELPAAPKKKRIASGKITPQKTGGFELPKLSLLSDVKIDKAAQVTKEYLEERKKKLLEVLNVYGITGEIKGICPGPVVTLFEFKPSANIKTTRITSLTDEIAREMRARSVRMALVPGEDYIGIELPNEIRASVYIKEMFTNDKFKHSEKLLTLALGKDIGGAPYYTDLAKMPHLLVAGTTGSGKSVAINTMILSLLYRLTPEQVRFILVDPKMLELSIYNGIPHLLTPVVIDPKKAVVALNWAVNEMEDRYLKMSRMNVRNIEGYNKKVREMIDEGSAEMPAKSVLDEETGEIKIIESQEALKPLPYIVIIVDEMADLMLTAGKEIEVAVQRIAQKARAAGIHMILATQRPSVNVITGTIKANFPERISFRLPSSTDSRTILNETGAEQLLGMGDMLYLAQGARPKRLHGPFVSDEEVAAVVESLKRFPAEYDESVTEETEDGFSGGADGAGFSDASGDSLYDQAVNIVLTDRKASTSYIQRRLSIGYNKAAKLIERMEREGVVSKSTPTGKRDILVPAHQ